MSKTEQYCCNRRVNYDNELHDAGQSIELSRKDAEPLLACGAISKPVPVALPANVTPLPPATSDLTDEEKQQAVVNAINVLNIDLPELWLKDGRPETSALMKIVPFKVTAKMRDAAWAEVVTDKADA